MSSMLKTTFEKEKSKILICWYYENINLNCFNSELLSKFHYNNVSFKPFENNFVNVLNKQAPKKSKDFCSN